MKLLLDTHIFLWYITGSNRLPNSLLETIRSPVNAIFLSSVSVWEIIVKHQLGKLPLPESPATYIPEQRQRHAIETLPLDEQSVSRLIHLPVLHRDPFDRMLMCQAIQHQLTLASTDEAIRAYADHVQVLQ